MKTLLYSSVSAMALLAASTANAQDCFWSYDLGYDGPLQLGESAIDDNNRVALLLLESGGGSTATSEIRVYDFDPSISSWIETAVIPMLGTAAARYVRPRIDVEGDTILVWGDAGSSGMQNEAQVFYNQGSDAGWTFGADLRQVGFSAANFPAPGTVQIPCPNLTPPATAPLTEPSEQFGAAGALVAVGAQIYACVGDPSYLHPCLPGVSNREDGSVWVFDVTPPTTTGLPATGTTFYADLIVRQLSASPAAANPGSSFGQALAASNGFLDSADGGFVAIGAPTFVVGGVNPLPQGTAYVASFLPMDPPVGALTQLTTGGTASTVKGESVAISRGWAFVQESNVATASAFQTQTHQLTGPATWTPNVVRVNGGTPVVDREATTLITSIPGTPSAPVGLQRYSVSGTTWSTAGAPRVQALPLSGTANLNFAAARGGISRDDCGGMASNYPALYVEESGNIPANTTGVISDSSIAGSILASNNDLVVTTTDLPQNQTAFYLVSDSFAMPFAGSMGLWLSPNFGRYNFAPNIFNTGSAGQVSMSIDLTSVPTSTGFRMVGAMDGIYLQLWHRDPTGPTGFGLSEMVGLTMQ